MVNQESIDRYINLMSEGQDEVLEWLEKQTNLRTNHSRMLSGAIVGRFLQFMAELMKAERILEIGCFTGYSAICMARGLAEGGHLDTLEVNDELEDLIREAFERAGLTDRIRLMIGDAKASLATLEGPYDLVYIDANKREYSEYFDLLIDKVRPGGYIMADNVLWDGKVAMENPPQDAQTVGLMRFNEKIKADPRVENIILPFRDGINMVRKRF